MEFVASTISQDCGMFRCGWNAWIFGRLYRPGTDFTRQHYINRDVRVSANGQIVIDRHRQKYDAVILTIKVEPQ